MKPGRELDALVAEKVFGHKVRTDGTYEVPPTRGLWPIPRYSEDIAAAWSVVEKLQPEYGFILDWTHGCMARFDSRERFVVGDTPAHAICLAALKVTAVV